MNFSASIPVSGIKNNTCIFCITAISKTVGIFSPLQRFFTESDFESQPICITFRPSLFKAAERFAVVVDFPIITY